MNQNRDILEINIYMHDNLYVTCVIGMEHKKVYAPTSTTTPSTSPLSGVYTSNLFKDLDFYLGQILSLKAASTHPTCLTIWNLIWAKYCPFMKLNIWAKYLAS